MRILLDASKERRRDCEAKVLDNMKGAAGRRRVAEIVPRDRRDWISIPRGEQSARSGEPRKRENSVHALHPSLSFLQCWGL